MVATERSKEVELVILEIGVQEGGLPLEIGVEETGLPLNVGIKEAALPLEVQMINDDLTCSVCRRRLGEEGKRHLTNRNTKYIIKLANNTFCNNIQQIRTPVRSKAGLPYLKALVSFLSYIIITICLTNFESWYSPLY